MAQITNLPDEITPSTPPDTTNVSTGPPQSSNQLRTPTTQPGFKPTQTVSRGALVSASPAPATHQSCLPQKNKRISVINSDNEDDDEDHSQNTDKGRNPFAGTKKVASRTGRKVVIDMAQDSDGGGPKQELIEEDITVVDDEITGLGVVEVDPDNAELASPVPGWEWNTKEDEEEEEGEATGIGFTLKK
ncbi:hypothetical protein PSHT_13840, partial [Puccinia striiformis]